MESPKSDFKLFGRLDQKFFEIEKKNKKCIILEFFLTDNKVDINYII